jgi:hypothetical protein
MNCKMVFYLKGGDLTEEFQATQYDLADFFFEDEFLKLKWCMCL